MDNISSKKAFQLYYDSYTLFKKLGNTKAGDLILAIFEYETKEVLPNFKDDMALDITFDVIKAYLDRNRENYNKKCEKNRENIKKRWSNKNDITNDEQIQNDTTVYDRIPSYTNGYETIRSDTKNTDNDSDKDSDNDNDNDNDNDSDSGNDNDSDKKIKKKKIKKEKSYKKAYQDYSQRKYDNLDDFYDNI